MEHIEMLIYIIIFIAAIYLVVKHWRTGKKR